MTMPSVKDTGTTTVNRPQPMRRKDTNDTPKVRRTPQGPSLRVLTRHARKAADGDMKALTALIEDHEFQRRLDLTCQWLYRRYNSFEDYRDWEDLRQDVIQRLLTKITQFQGKSSILTYVSRIATNIHLSHLRRTALAHAHTEVRQLNLPEDNVLVDLESQIALHRAIDKLSDRQQYVLRRRLEDATLRQVALELGCSVSVVCALQKRVQERLVKCVEDEKKGTSFAP